MTPSDPLILAADIGGTNTRLALFDGARMRAGSTASYRNKGVRHLNAHLERYLSEHSAQPDLLTLALAGPVQGQTGQLTNLKWKIIADESGAVCGAQRAVLLNDLQAQGHALAHVDPSHVTMLHGAAVPDVGQTKLVINLGTGLNVAAVYTLPDGSVFVPPAEAGHITFSPQDPSLASVGEVMLGNMDHLAQEDVLSGRGMSNIYTALTDRSCTPQDIIDMRRANDPDAVRAISLMARALGAYAGDMALVHLARGGVYLVGGAARALVPYLTPADFEAAYLNKGRFSDVTRAIPVQVVEDDFAALNGAVHYALQSV